MIAGDRECAFGCLGEDEDAPAGIGETDDVDVTE